MDVAEGLPEEFALLRRELAGIRTAVLPRAWRIRRRRPSRGCGCGVCVRGTGRIRRLSRAGAGGDGSPGDRAPSEGRTAGSVQ